MRPDRYASTKICLADLGQHLAALEWLLPLTPKPAMNSTMQPRQISKFFSYGGHFFSFCSHKQYMVGSRVGPVENGWC